ncbi:MAG: hypothetical protein QOJ38_1371 [Solirubrobacterales bacterium]|jgi:hypothetical protein|nr:hypothetical protein [Solirubrobacterales bacterium]
MTDRRGWESTQQLPEPRGPASEFVVECLASEREPSDARAPSLAFAAEEEDLQLALYLTYELAYRSFEGVDPRWEWSPAILAVRAQLEEAFLERLRAEVPPPGPVEPEGLASLLFELAANDDGPSLSRFLETRGTELHFREFVIHRSAYQLKEADPHSWAIPRLSGAAKAALIEVQADEYGGGRPGRMHSQLFAATMEALGLDSSYGAYLDSLPAVTLATVNLMSMLGLQRRWRGAIVGHLAMFEMTSPLPNRRYGNGLRRLGFGSGATEFYDEHVEADSVHENVAAYDLAGGLARQEPALTADIVFGAQALLWLEDRFARHLLGAWRQDQSSLRATAPAELSVA